jgi:putative transposon-encoded protein
MRKIEIKNKKILQEDDIAEVYEETVKPIGNGAMIMSAKKYIGKNVYVIVRKSD